jgi:pectate lyase
VLGASGCTLEDADLIVAPAGENPPPPLPPEVIAAIDERPVGGASLTSGTRGGGTHAEARAAGALHVVATLADLKTRAGGDAPAVVLVTAGRYIGTGEQRTAQICRVPCAAHDPVREGTLAAKDCPPDAPRLDVTYAADTLRVGSNKTIIGLGSGAHLQNVSVSLDGSSNVILRNVAIEAVQTEVPSAANALSLQPSHHVWLDHLSLRDVSHTGLDIASTWDEENAQAVDDESGYITVSDVHFDGFMSKSCSQRSELVFTSNRNPALTITGSWFDGARIRAPNLLGPGTWAHFYNNLWSNIDGRGLAVSCGAVALAQGNVFRGAHNALYNSDSGVPTWQFCSAGYFGTLYAPLDTGVDETNLFDETSTMNLGGQPVTGTGAVVPKRVAGSEFELTVPVAAGTRNESYRVTLASDPASVAASVQAAAGVGQLF